jgi:hypothetical protein
MGQLRGRSPEGGGADGDDARIELGAEEELRWRKTSEEDAWAMGMNVRRSGVDGRDEWRAGSEKFSTGGRRLCFNGKRRGGGPEGWTLRGGGVGEREGEGGGPSAAWRGRGRAARCLVTVENGGVGATRVDMADRWAGTLRGPDVSGWVRRGAARRRQLGSAAQCARLGFQTESNLFQTDSNLS